MKELIIHMGTYKTGSTTLQNFFKSNRESLLKNGIFYPEFLDEVGYYDLRNGNSYPLAIDDNECEDRAIAGLSNYFKQHDVILISSEDLWGSERKKEKLMKLKSIGAKIRLIIYLRRQDEYLNSLYNQLIKQDCKFVYDGEWETAVSWHHADYDKEINIIEGVIPRENICIRVYDRDKLDGNDICTDFLRFVGISEKQSFCYGEGTNDSLSDAYRNIKMLCNNVLNDKVGDWPDPLGYRLTDALIQTDKKIKRRKSSMFSKAERIAIMKKYEPGNKNIAQRFFNRDRLFEYENSVFDNSNKQTVETKEELEAFISVFASYYILNERRLNSFATRLDDVERMMKDVLDSKNAKMLQLMRGDSNFEKLIWKANAYDAIVNSNSWQLTAPLRVVGRIIRRFLNKGK